MSRLRCRRTETKRIIGNRVYRSVLNRYREFLNDAPRADVPLPHFKIFERDGRWHWNLHGLGRHGIIARARKDGYADKRSAIAATHHLVRQATRARNRFDFRM